MNLLLSLLLQVENDKDTRNAEEAADFDDDLIDLEALLDDDIFMPTAT